MDETDAITIENGYPLTDKEAEKLAAYKFTIKNKCNTSVTYDVSLEIMESKDEEGKDNRLASEYIAISFDGAKKVMLDTLEETIPTYQKGSDKAVEGRYLVSGELGGKGSQSYTIKLWIDEHVEVEDDAMNKNFRSKIVVDANLNPIAKNFNEYIMEQVKNNTEIEEFTHAATDQTEALTDYRYVGSDPNNYVCLSEEETCPEDNLYRIIGIIPMQESAGGEYKNLLKLIKAKPYVGPTISSGATFGENQKGYPFASANFATWDNEYLSDTFNGEYYNALGEYKNYIVASVWYLGTTVYTNNDTYTPNQLYTVERSATSNTIKNIGLMYPSDYGYSIGKNYIDQAINNSKGSYTASSWLLYKVGYEWTISPSSMYSGCYGSYTTIILNSGGILYSASLRGGYSTSCTLGEKTWNHVTYGLLNARPTFYLNENILYQSGNGSIESPFKISINE